MSSGASAHALTDTAVPTRPGLVHARRLAALVVALAILRGALGAILNAPGIGPDERGHLQYLQTFATGGWSGVQGVEARQPPTGYLPALAIWWLAGGPTDPQSQVFAPVTLSAPTLGARLASVAWSGVTAWATWHLARVTWPSRPWMALLGTTLASLTPGYLYVMASVTNEPAATALATLAIFATARAIHAPSPQRRAELAIWAIAAVAAVTTKLTNAPVVLATGVTLLWALRASWRPWLHRRPIRLAAWAAGAIALAGYGALLTRHPSSSYAATAARVWPEAIVTGSIAFVRDGAATEALRTFWHAWDYDVAWPPDLDGALTFMLATGVGLAAFGAIAGTLLGASPFARTISTRHAFLWFPVIAQVGFAVVRFGIGTVAGAMMGGAAQAKTFFPAIAPASLLGAAGLVTVASLAWSVVTRPRTLHEGDAAARPGREDASLVRSVTLAVIACLLAADLIGLAASIWRHGRWIVPGAP